MTKEQMLANLLKAEEGTNEYTEALEAVCKELGVEAQDVLNAMNPPKEEVYNGVYQMELQMEVTSKKTGKPYKKWSFLGWYPINKDLSKHEHKLKGDWLHVYNKYEGSWERYNVSNGVARHGHSVK